MPEPNKIQPRPTAVSAPYWDGCAAGELRPQYCPVCAAHQFYPRIVCSKCGGTDLEWRQASGKGVIASFTVVRRGVSAAYEGPYVVALIDLEEGVRLMSQVVTADPDDGTFTIGALKVGAKVAVAFARWSDEVAVPVFEIEG